MLMCFPFDDVLKLKLEEEALLDIPSFPSINDQQATPEEETSRNSDLTLAKHLFPHLWFIPC